LALKVLPANDVPDYTVNSDKARLFRFASHVADASNEYVIESKAGYKKDTTGAGDAFATGFLYGLLNGKGFEKCGRLGSLVAQFSITKTGVRQGLPTLNELVQRYRELHLEQL